MGIGQLIVHSIRLIYNRAGLLNLLSPAGAELEGGVVGISRGLGTEVHQWGPGRSPGRGSGLGDGVPRSWSIFKNTQPDI